MTKTRQQKLSDLIDLSKVIRRGDTAFVIGHEGMEVIGMDVVTGPSKVILKFGQSMYNYRTVALEAIIGLERDVRGYRTTIWSKDIGLIK